MSLTTGGPLLALSLTQPWAALVAHGEKRYETRSWPPRGRTFRLGDDIAIHAAKVMPEWAATLCDEEPFLTALSRHLYDPSAHGLARDRGVIVAVARVTAAYPTDSPALHALLTEQERAFGDYGPGRWAWQLDDVRRLAQPIVCRGALGLWPVPAAVEALVRHQMAGVAS